MFTVEFDFATVHFGPLIFVLLIALIVGIVRAIILSKKTKKMVELCRTGKYNASIALAKRQLKCYQRPLKTKYTRQIIDILYLHIAISNFALSDNDQFLKNITVIDDKNSDKHFWLALFYLLNNDSINFKNHYEILAIDETAANYLTYLSSIEILQKDNKDDAAQTALSSLYHKLNYELLKDITKKFVCN